MAGRGPHIAPTNAGERSLVRRNGSSWAGVPHIRRHGASVKNRRDYQGSLASAGSCTSGRGQMETQLPPALTRSLCYERGIRGMGAI